MLLFLAFNAQRHLPHISNRTIIERERNVDLRVTGSEIGRVASNAHDGAQDASAA